MKNQALKCSQLVRNIPLERFCLPADGRKWMQAARSRSELLLRLSSYANGDGTFTRDGKNYSPSFRTIAKHVAKKSFYRVTNALRELGLLSWTRALHYERRIYTIHLPESGVTFNSEQVSDSEKSGAVVTLENKNQVSDSPEQVSRWPKTGVLVAHIPSLPSKALTLQPSNQPSVATPGLVGGAVGETAELKDAGSNQDAGKVESVLTAENLMWEEILKAHREIVGEMDKQYGDRYGDIPLAPSSAGRDELFLEFQKRGCSVALLGEAYKNWFGAEYVARLDEIRDAEKEISEKSCDGESSAQTARRCGIYIPNKFQSPLKIFSHKLTTYLDQAREQTDEE